MEEISSCSCLTVLPGPAWVMLSKTNKPLFYPLYRYRMVKNELLKRGNRLIRCRNFKIILATWALRPLPLLLPPCLCRTYSRVGRYPACLRDKRCHGRQRWRQSGRRRRRYESPRMRMLQTNEQDKTQGVVECEVSAETCSCKNIPLKFVNHPSSPEINVTPLIQRIADDN